MDGGVSIKPLEAERSPVKSNRCTCSPAYRRRLRGPARASPFFPHKLVKGYGSPAGAVVRAVNGIPTKDLRHLVEVLRPAATNDNTEDRTNDDLRRQLQPHAAIIQFRRDAEARIPHAPT